jgi:hypothetical protein
MDNVKQPNPLGGEGRYEADPQSNKVGLTPEEIFRSEVPEEGAAGGAPEPSETPGKSDEERGKERRSEW